MAEDKKPDAPDLSSMASDYMDLWQKQLSAFASDETVASVMAQTAQLMNNSAVAVAAMTTAQKTAQKTTGKSQDGTDHKQPGGDASGTKATGTASGADEHAVERLTERLERLEERIAALESGTVETGK